MRRDVCYYFESDVVSVYNAYLAAATNSKFRREPHQEPYHTLQFGLNFSMKYNFNGGSCTIHFMPYQSGTAIDLRFSIAQLAGARYEAYARDLTNDTSQVLRVVPQKINLDIEMFLNENNKVKADAVPPVQVAPQTVVATPAPTPAPATTQTAKYCSNCGTATDPGARFCSACGQKLAADKKVCSGCGCELKENFAFCSQCGTKVN